MKLKVVLAVVAAIGLSGCAFNQAQQLPDDKYSDFVNNLVGMDKCLKAGYMSPELYAKGRSALNYFLNTWKYDEELLNTKYRLAYVRLGEANESECRVVAGHTEGTFRNYEQTVDNAQRAADREHQQWVEAAEALNQNKTTWCNKVGNTVMCR